MLGASAVDDGALNNDVIVVGRVGCLVLLFSIVCFIECVLYNFIFNILIN